MTLMAIEIKPIILYNTTRFTKRRFVWGKNTQNHWIVYIVQFIILNMNMESILKFIQRLILYFNFSFVFIKKCQRLSDSRAKHATIAMNCKEESSYVKIILFF